ncbi:MAG: SDR family oxidoreductase [Firmicutes bacterium]|nr:SDR family oxidoreductase [Bacillota bacterium]
MKDYFGYQGKTVVVTGASSGMGKAAAKMLVDLGAEVYALSRREPDVPGIKAFIATDLSSKESIDHAFTELPASIDAFFGIAGASGLHDDFLTTVKIDLLSNKYMTEEYLVKRMPEGGSIAYMTSTAGNGWELEENKKYVVPVVSEPGWDAALAALEASPVSQLPGNLGYSYSKLAMNYLVAQYQETFAPKKIRVNAVLPGSTDTGLTDDFSEMIGGMENLLEFTGYAGRLATPEEMAAPIVFLNSAMASYVSGELLVADYGLTAEAVSGIRPNPLAVTLEALLTMFK